MWWYEAEARLAPRNWLRWAVNLLQLEYKVTRSNATDQQIGTYLVDADTFLTTDVRFFTIVKRIRDVAPVAIAEPCLIRADEPGFIEDIRAMFRGREGG